MVLPGVWVFLAYIAMLCCAKREIAQPGHSAISLGVWVFMSPLLRLAFCMAWAFGGFAVCLALPSDCKQSKQSTPTPVYKQGQKPPQKKENPTPNRKVFERACWEGLGK